MIKFSSENQSPWIVNFYNKYLPNIGYLVEVGVGHLISPVYKLGTPFNSLQCGSNSYDLIKSGWSALLIDPIKEYCEEALLVYSKDSNVTIECFGVSDREEELTFNMEDTFIPNNTPVRNDLPYIGRKCKLYPFSYFLEKNKVPNNFDLLSIDVEGFELKVLKTFNTKKYFPKIIIVETNPTPTEAVLDVLSDSYTLAQKDNINSLFVRKDLI